MSVEVRGADQLAALARALKDAGDKGLQRELGKAVNRAVKPLKDDLRKSALEKLPSRGGFARAIAASKITARRRVSARAAGVRLVSSNRFSQWHPDQGQIRHRVKGKPASQWPVQRVEPGWWTDPTQAAAPEVRREIVAAMDDIAKRVGRAL